MRTRCVSFRECSCAKLIRRRLVFVAADIPSQLVASDWPSDLPASPFLERGSPSTRCCTSRSTGETLQLSSGTVAWLKLLLLQMRFTWSSNSSCIQPLLLGFRIITLSPSRIQPTLSARTSSSQLISLPVALARIHLTSQDIYVRPIAFNAVARSFSACQCRMARR